jgi:hypothetical protein
MPVRLQPTRNHLRLPQPAFEMHSLLTKSIHLYFVCLVYFVDRFFPDNKNNPRNTRKNANSIRGCLQSRGTSYAGAN